VANWLSRPLAHHEFLNLRTYVRHGDERGIFFLAEWIPNRLATLLGPWLYGLPYRLGRLQYDTTTDRTARRVVGEHGSFHCQAAIAADRPAVCAPGSQAAFLLERYTAFTHRHGVLRRFRIHHEPWLQVPAQVVIEKRDLLPPYLLAAEPCTAHHSRGLHDVLISAPQRLSCPAARRSTAGSAASSPPDPRIRESGGILPRRPNSTQLAIAARQR
jgi:uncharacterized protein YqjF (DUF2071 family)